MRRDWETICSEGGRPSRPHPLQKSNLFPLFSGRKAAFPAVFACGLPAVCLRFADCFTVKPAVKSRQSLWLCCLIVRPVYAVLLCAASVLCCVLLCCLIMSGLSILLRVRLFSSIYQPDCESPKSFFTDNVLLQARNKDSLHYYRFVVNFFYFMLDFVSICSIL